tara:strand:+ start:183 stop:380 length:198 start_codon:yes stop_codon:yes gene_type:complete
MIYKLLDNSNSNELEIVQIYEDTVSIRIIDYELLAKNEEQEVEVNISKKDLYTLIGALHTIQKYM